jgi:hypothetical protein
MFVSYDKFREDLLLAIDRKRYDVPPDAVMRAWHGDRHTVTTALSIVRVRYGKAAASAQEPPR